jgi:hypothetical protein
MRIAIFSRLRYDFGRICKNACVQQDLSFMRKGHNFLQQPLGTRTIRHRQHEADSALQQPSSFVGQTQSAIQKSRKDSDLLGLRARNGGSKMNDNQRKEHSMPIASHAFLGQNQFHISR